MARQVYADNVDANGKVFETVGENIRNGARAGELIDFSTITDKLDALGPEISSLQADVTENKSGIKKNSDDIDLLKEIYKQIENIEKCVDKFEEIDELSDHVSKVKGVFIDTYNKYNKETDLLGYGITTQGVATPDSRFRLSQGIKIPNGKTFAVSAVVGENTSRQYSSSIRSFTIFSDKDCTEFVSQDASQTNTKYTNNTGSDVYVRLLCWYQHPTAKATDVMLEIFDSDSDIALNEYIPYGTLVNEKSVFQSIEKIVEETSEEMIAKMSGGTFIQTILHGATTEYPSNTLELYKRAYKRGITNWECDIINCTDDYVLCHDNDIYNHAVTENGETIAQNTVLITSNNLETLKSYKFGVITGEQASGVVSGFENERIPTLREFLMLAKACGATPFVEVKFYPTLAHMTNIMNIIKECNMLDETYIIAYGGGENVSKWCCQNGLKNISIIVENGSSTNDAIDTADGWISEYKNQLKNIYFNPSTGNVNSSATAYAASKGMKMCTWTIPVGWGITNIMNLYNAGCTAFTSNWDDVGGRIKEYILN